jgi:hypothetical protein
LRSHIEKLSQASQAVATAGFEFVGAAIAVTCPLERAVKESRLRREAVLPEA